MGFPFLDDGVMVLKFDSNQALFSSAPITSYGNNGTEPLHKPVKLLRKEHSTAQQIPQVGKTHPVAHLHEKKNSSYQILEDKQKQLNLKLHSGDDFNFQEI